MRTASILIVEDEAIIAADLARQLKLLGYKIIGSSDRGEEAVELARQHRPSLIMMDIRLAGEMDGIDSAIAIRRETALPVVFLTAHCDAITLKRAGLSDAFGYILKPFDERDLRVQIEMALQRHATRQLLFREKAQLEGYIKDTENALGRTREELRGLAASLITAQETERQRVSRELHDDLGQKVALIELNAARMEQKFKQSEADVPAEILEMRKQTTELAQDLRGLALRLHPSILDDLGLPIALRRLVETFGQAETMRVTFSSGDLPDKIPKETAAALYRIAQEALRNVARHAGRTQVEVALHGRGPALQLQIRDRGRGFEPSEVRGRGGMGILNMEERTRLIGGTFKLQARPGNGVQITALVPLPARIEKVTKKRRRAS